jgi:hypothetical protein
VPPFRIDVCALCRYLLCGLLLGSSPPAYCGSMEAACRRLTCRALSTANSPNASVAIERIVEDETITDDELVEQTQRVASLLRQLEEALSPEAKAVRIHLDDIFV